MKHLRGFNESKDFSDEVNDILNIARDEYDCVLKAYDRDHCLFIIYNDFDNKDKFQGIIRDVIDRLYDIEEINKRFVPIICADRYGKFSPQDMDILNKSRGMVMQRYEIMNRIPLSKTWIDLLGSPFIRAVNDTNWYEDPNVIVNDFRSVEITIKKKYRYNESIDYDEKATIQDIINIAVDDDSLDVTFREWEDFDASDGYVTNSFMSSRKNMLSSHSSSTRKGWITISTLGCKGGRVHEGLPQVDGRSRPDKKWFDDKRHLYDVCIEMCDRLDNENISYKTQANVCVGGWQARDTSYLGVSIKMGAYRHINNIRKLTEFQKDLSINVNFFFLVEDNI